MMKLYFCKKSDFFFFVWAIIYSIIAVYIFYSRQGFTKDELFYLGYVNSQNTSISYFLADSIHFLQPLLISIWVRFTNDLPIYLLNLPFFIFSCKFLLNSTRLNPIIFLIMLMPTAHYCGTYLREPILFSMIFLFMGCILRNYYKLAILAVLIIFPIRFYWAVAAFGFLAYTKNFRLLPHLLVLFSLLAIYFQDQILYVYSSLSLIQFNPMELLRVFLVPLPALSFIGDVNLYENAILFSIIFPIKIFLCLFFLLYVINLFLGSKHDKDERLILFFALIILFSTAITSLVGPRQVILGQSLMALSIFGRYKFTWRNT